MELVVAMVRAILVKIIQEVVVGLHMVQLAVILLLSGSGIVILRYLDESHTNEPVSNNYDNNLLFINVYNILSFKYLNDVKYASYI